MLPVIIAIIAVVAIVGFWFVSIYNGIVTKDNRCDNAWQTIDAQLQRRNDLIPNLVETVKGYAAHESGTLQAVTEARAAVANAGTPEEKMEASNMLSGTLKTLFAVAEAYPDLKANTNFQELQHELSETENKISYARQSFNDCVLEYNNAIETFPGNIVAGSKFRTRQGFEVTDAAARQAPQVKF
ncbi:MAG: LemA family protein [Olsenella sp.]|nr:LemA family protein [Olsenella sp.]